MKVLRWLRLHVLRTRVRYVRITDSAEVREHYTTKGWVR